MGNRFSPSSKATRTEYERERSFYHFNDRLKERYGIEISFEEYKELCHVPVVKLKKEAGYSKVGILEIKGVNVLVVKGIKRRRLITALPIGKLRRIVKKEK